MPDPVPFSALEARLGYTFRNPALLREALTHPSYLQDHPEDTTHNQRLEFLGDSVLNFVLSAALFDQFTEDREGVLSRRRAVLTKGDFLSQLSLELGVDDALLLGSSEEDVGGRTRPSSLEDALEAIVGAIFRDSDFVTVQGVVLKWYGDIAKRLAANEHGENPKGRLQEIFQPEHGNNALRYDVISADGPEHLREYHVAVFLHERELGQGKGSSKKAAEEEAARAALGLLEDEAASDLL